MVGYVAAERVTDFKAVGGPQVVALSNISIGIGKGWAESKKQQTAENFHRD
jgi:hypothetical protein